MRHCYPIIFLFGLFLALPAYASLGKLTKLQEEGARVSAYVVNLNTNKTMYEMMPQLRLTPASLTKLVIGADALETWGPEKTFLTQMLRRGTLENHVLNGDLIFYGGGDATLTNEKLSHLIDGVSHAGIEKITGKIIVNASLFGDIDKDTNRAKAATHSHSAYDAPLSSAAVNYSVVTISIAPPQSRNQKAIIKFEPFSLPNFKLVNHVQVIVRGNTKVTEERTTYNGIDTFTISGKIALKSPPVLLYKSISDANFYAGEVIQAFLKYQRIETSGKIEIEKTPIKPTDVLVSQIDSDPLAWQLRGMLKRSNNFIADTLTLQIGEENHIPLNKNILESSSLCLEKYMQTITGNIPTVKPILLKSGSGLTSENKLSAQDIVTLLNRMYLNGPIFPEFLTALASPDEEGSLKHRFPKKANQRHEFLIRAKTGTLTDPENAVGLAGYSRLKNGDWISYAFLINDKNKKRDIDYLRASIDSDLLEVLSAD